MDKLLKAKAIMNATDGMKRGEVRNINNNMVENFHVPNAKYNIPDSILGEAPKPKNSNIGPQTTIESIQKSKLPDDIKKLMIEHPIAKPNQPETSISNELIEKASRLMRREDNNYIPESAKSKKDDNQKNEIDYSIIKKMINDAVKDALKENGMIAESTEKSNEIFSFKVGKHIFEGKVTKIKKLG